MKFSSMEEANQFLSTRGYDSVCNENETTFERNNYICHRNGKYELTGTNPRRIQATKKNVQDPCKAYCSITKIGYSFILRGNFKHNHNDIHDTLISTNKRVRTKNFKCHKCDFKSTSATSLRGHIKSVHDKIKDNVCQECGYKCSLKTVLDKHIKAVHLKLKNYFCDECGYSSFNKARLQLHQQSVHLNMRSFICEQCGMAFNGKSGLNTHKKVVHLKIKKFVCQLCGYASALSGNLKKHAATVHNL